MASGRRSAADPSAAARRVPVLAEQEWQGLVDRGPSLLSVDQFGERAFWQFLFLTRHLVIAGLAVAVLLLPEFRDHRWEMAALLGGVVLPYDVGTHVYARRFHRMPTSMPFVYAPVPAIFVALYPEAFIPALLAALGNLVLFAATFHVRIALASTLLSVVAMAVAAAIGEPSMARLGAVTYAFIAPAVVLGVGALFEALSISRQRYREYVENANDLIYVHDLDGNFLAANETALRVTGYTRDELGSVSLADVIPPEYLAEAVSRMHRAVEQGSGGSVPWELEVITKSGVRVPVEVNTSLMMRRGRAIALQGIARDITERRQVAAQREALDHARTEFIANAAHELRTPLTTLAGLAAVLTKTRPEMTEEEMDEALQALVRQGKRARALADRLLDLSALELGRDIVKSEPVEVASAVTQALEDVFAPEDAKVDVEVDGTLAVLADPVRLQEILNNLITNAYRYGGHQVSVRAGRENGGVVIEVADDGPGVPELLVSQLFEPFAKGDHADGTGLGLAICARLATAQGGEITYHAERGCGACFRLRLPAARV